MQVLLGESNRDICSALKVLLHERLNSRDVDEVHTREDLLTISKSIKPDLAIVNLELAGNCLPQILSGLRLRKPSTCVIVLSRRLETRQLAIESGADYFINTTESPEQLLKAVNAINSLNEFKETKPSPAERVLDDSGDEQDSLG